MKVTTKRGDQGMTDLFGGIRIAKSDQRVMLLGVCDGLQSLLGIVKNLISDPVEQQYLTSLQQILYTIMGSFAGASKISQQTIALWVSELEKKEEQLLFKTPIQSKFVLPGSTLIEAWLQFIRTHVRSCERQLVANTKKHPDLARYIPFFNRLSDYFFILGQAHGLSQKDTKV